MAELVDPVAFVCLRCVRLALCMCQRDSTPLKCLCLFVGFICAPPTATHPSTLAGVRAAIRRLNKADYAALTVAERVAILKYLVDCVTATINFSEMMDDVDVQRQEAMKEHASEEERYMARIKKQKQEAKETSAERIEKLQEQLKLALEELGEDDETMAPKPKA